MKKIINLSIALLLVVSVKGQVSFCEDFEGYQTGDPIAETSPNWNTWAELGGGTAQGIIPPPFNDDALVSSNLASSGSNSLYFLGVGAGGPQDIILMFDPTQNITQPIFGNLATPYLVGDFEFSQNMRIRSGSNGAYFNLQAMNDIGDATNPTPGEWSLEVNFNFDPINPTDPGTIEMGNTINPSLLSASVAFPWDTWFEIKFEVNLSSNVWEVFIDNQSLGSFSNPVNKLASIDYYTRVGTVPDEYYVDDVCYSYSPFNPLAYDMEAIDITTPSNVGLSSSPFTISGEILNLSANVITSVDVNYSINGAAPIVDNLTGLNLTVLDILPFNHTISWTPPSTGAYLVEIWASNINNGNIDMDPTNDIFSDSIYVWNATAIRQPLIETFTSSTCGPCNPANVTAEALFAQNSGRYTSIKYQADFPGTGDPYYTLEGGNRRSYYAINSVPRMEIDGGWDQNGNNITQQVLDDHINIISFMNLSATYSINIQTVDIDITIDPLEDYNSADLVVHAAIIEEITYNNVKNNGETQFEHVVKKMLPDDNGTSIASLTGGAQSTLNLQYEFQGNYRLPADASNPINHTTEHSVEDFSSLMVAVWVQDVVTKEVHQSTMATLSSVTPVSFNCINNTCVDPMDGTGNYTSLAACQTDSACATLSIVELDNLNKITIYPNPAMDNIYLSNLTENTTLKIYDISGRLVLETSVSNKEYVNISTLSKGIYQIKLKGGDWSETRKLIKE